MNYIDISWPISKSMTTYKNRGDVYFEQIKTIEINGVCESTLKCNTHTGTHIDAPAHIIKDGITIDKIPFDWIIGQAIVIDCTFVNEKITKTDLLQHENLIKKYPRILFKTKNSESSINDPFNPNFIYIEKDAALFLKSCNVKLIGIDYLGIERNQPKHPTHNILLENGIILEGIRLSHVNPGIYTLHVLPLFITGSDSAPARALLIDKFVFI